MYKAIIFDFFDVIAPDFYRVWLENNGYERKGRFLALAKDIDNGRISLEEYYNQLGVLGNQPAGGLRNEWENFNVLNQDMLQLIEILRKRYKVSLLTNSPADLVRRILRRNKLEHYFDSIVISGEVHLVKPNEDIYNITLDKLSVSAKETIFVDDKEEYVKAAERLGITGIRFVNAKKLVGDFYKLGITADLQ